MCRIIAVSETKEIRGRTVRLLTIENDEGDVIIREIWDDNIIYEAEPHSFKAHNHPDSYSCQIVLCSDC